MAKEDVLAQFAQAQNDAVSAVYDAGFIAGVASVPGNDSGGGISAEQEAADIQAAVATAQAALQVEIDELKIQLSAGVDAFANLQALELSIEDKLNKIKALLN